MKGNPEKLAQYLFQLDKNKIYEIKEVKRKRGLNSNSKYWKLINELSLKLKISVEKLHFEMLKNYSTRFEMLVPATTEIRGIEYYERKSKIVKDGKEYIVYQVYTPSHELKTDEFAILLDGLIQECKQQGIDTRSPSEILMEEQIYGRNMERY